MKYAFLIFFLGASAGFATGGWATNSDVALDRPPVSEEVPPAPKKQPLKKKHVITNEDLNKMVNGPPPEVPSPPPAEGHHHDEGEAYPGAHNPPNHTHTHADPHASDPHGSSGQPESHSNPPTETH